MKYHPIPIRIVTIGRKERREEEEREREVGKGGRKEGEKRKLQMLARM